MTAPNNKPLSQEDKARFAAYKGTSLHLVLNNNNVKDGHVEHCIQTAARHGDQEGYELGLILRGMSKSQRLKLARSL